MDTCTECGRGRLSAVLLPEYAMEIGGIRVCLLDAVVREVCDGCGEATIEIPNLEQLAKAVVMARVLLPERLRGSDVRLMRTVLDMNGRQFAEAMELQPETVSRWENGERGIGGYSEKLLRHNVAALLHKDVPGVEYDPASITRMRIADGPDDAEPIVVQCRRVVVKEYGHREDAWDPIPHAA